MAAYTVKTMTCIIVFAFIHVQICHGLNAESMATKTCIRQLPFKLKTQTNLDTCPSKSLTLRSRMTRNSQPGRRKRSLLLPGVPLLPLLPPIIPKLPLLPLPILPLLPPLPPIPKLKPLKPLKVPILGKRSISKIGSNLKPIKIPGLEIKAGKRKILDHLNKLKRKGSLSTQDYLRIRKLFLK